jgi:hypothetical protein
MCMEDKNVARWANGWTEHHCQLYMCKGTAGIWKMQPMNIVRHTLPTDPLCQFCSSLIFGVAFYASLLRYKLFCQFKEHIFVSVLLFTTDYGHIWHNCVIFSFSTKFVEGLPTERFCVNFARVWIFVNASYATILPYKSFGPLIFLCIHIRLKNENSSEQNRLSSVRRNEGFCSFVPYRDLGHTSHNGVIFSILFCSQMNS